MFATALISFREFLEAFLIAGVFLGISKNLQLKKEKEIILALTIGICLSFALSLITYLFGDQAKIVLSQDNAEILEGYLLVFSGLFLAYVVFSLHEVLSRGRSKKILVAHKKLEEQAFNISVFGTIIFLIVREGFEIALFTASVSLFSSFIQNTLGLFMGFFAAGLIGLSTFYAYIKLPIYKVFKVTEYGIIILGAALFQKGITELLEIHFNYHISDIVPFQWHFLPDSESLIGTVLSGFLGIDAEMSLLRLLLMVGYCTFVYVLFIRQKPKSS